MSEDEDGVLARKPIEEGEEHLGGGLSVRAKPRWEGLGRSLCEMLSGAWRFPWCLCSDGVQKIKSGVKGVGGCVEARRLYEVLGSKGGEDRIETEVKFSNNLNQR